METNNLRTALLIMDMQQGIIGRLPDAQELLKRTSKAIKYARDHKIPVIYVVLGFRAGAPEISEYNKSFFAHKPMMAAANMEEMMKVPSPIDPKSDEMTVIKRRVSAFSGSDLDVVLRALGIQHLILTGVSTSGVVLSTIREAADKDYVLTVLSDCCADPDAELHSVLISKVFPRQAEVLTAEEWIK